MKLKKLLAGILSVAMILGCLILPITVSADPIGVSDAAGLAAISSNVKGTYVLTANIDMTDVSWTPIAGFAGTLDGAGYTISNLTVSVSGSAALFASLTSGAVVKDLTISASSFTGTGTNPCGAFAAQATGATLNNVKTTNSVSVTGGWVGGIIGRDNGNCNVTYAVNNASVSSSSSYAGGIVGILTASSASTYSYCINYGTISNTAGNTYAAGIAGRFNNVNVNYCLNEGTINTSYRGTGFGAMAQDGASTWTNCVNNTTNISAAAGWAFGAFAQAGGTVAANNCYWLAGNANLQLAHSQHGANVSGTDSVACAADNEITALQGFAQQIKDAVAGKTTINSNFVIGEAPVAGWNGTAKQQPSGAGTEGDPYLISCPEELAYFSGQDTSTAFLELTTDLDLNGKTFAPIGVIRGTFDGKGHTISNFTVSAAVSGRVGLIGAVAGGKVKNLTIDNATISGASNGSGGVGAIAGYVNGTALLSHLTVGENVTVTETAGSDIATDYVGGVAGYVQTAATIEYCVNRATVASSGGGTGSIGGIIGFSQAAAAISYCANYGTITGPESTRTQYVGGIVGQMRTATISHCLNAGRVEGHHIAAGIAAYSYSGNAGHANNCVNISTQVIASADWMGGLFGRVDGTITSDGCYTVTTQNLQPVAVSTAAANCTLTDLTTDNTEANAAIVANAGKNLANAIAKGTAINAITASVQLAAYQTTEIQNHKFSIRFIATVDDYSAYSRVGFQVGTADLAHHYDVAVDTVYTALLETVGGDKIYKEAWELNGNFLAAYSITDIGDTDELDIVVVILAEKDGQSPVYSAKRFQISGGAVVNVSDFDA